MGKDWLFGKPNIFLLFLFFLPGNTSPTTEPQYMVLLPFLIHTDAPEKVCIQLTHLNESVTLSATLEYQGENRSLIDDVVSEKDIFTCIPFSLPKSNSTSVAFLTVMVKGETQQFRSRKSVLVKNSESLVFVQTDKPIYKPGQTVLFRIVSLDKDFHPLNEKFPLVYIQDPQRNRIYQWQGVELEIGLIELSFPLTSDPMQGSYKIVVQKSVTSHVEHSFSVEEYVLPKYEVLVKLPKMITIEDKEIPVSVCGLYTYGKPVPGLVNVQVCRKFSHSGSHCYGKDSEAVCEEFVRQADARGCVSDVVRTKIFQLQRSGYKMNIEVQGKITEDGTGIEMVGTGSCEITSIMSKVSFHLLDSYYRPGIPLFGMVKLVDGIDAPIANETIRISVNEGNYEGNYTTDEQGQSWFSIDTTTFTEASLEIRAEHKPELNCYDSDWITPSYEHALHSISRFYSPSNSFLKIEPKHETLSCGFPTEVRVHYVFTPDVIGEQKKIVIYYLVMAKGSIMLADTHDLTVNPGDAYGIFRLTFPVEATIAPKARMLVYTTLPSGEVIASSADFQVESCLPNKVSLSFIPKEGLPASNTRLQLHSSPKSLCAIRAVDKSVLLMKPEDELSHRSLYDLLPEEMKEIQGYSFKDYYLEDDNVNPCLSLDNILLNGFVYVPISPDGKGDAYDILKLLGLKVFTSSKIHKPEICRRYREHVMESNYMVANFVDSMQPYYDSYEMMEETDAGHPVETIRKYFPETWIWDIVSVNSEGNAELDVTIPDTITEWKANAFCTSSDTGFGLSPTVSLRAFQPFFVELTLPYSVVRGEAFTLKATIFNYLTACIRVSVSLAKSTHFLAAPVEKEEESYCICLNERKTVAWAVTPKSLGQVEFSVSAEALQNQQPCGNAIVETPEKGRKDTVIRQLLVEPEGMEVETTYNSVICASEKSMSETVALVLPENVVDGSARAYFSVLGDIMGTSMQNLHQLLQMPFGCGEQNMVLFAPNIYVLDYLNKTGQLSEEIKSKAIGYLVSGYQRQLNYKHWDGSYSTFGPQFGQAGNTWLTAFVLKSFAQARPYIFIYEKHIQDALIWLTQKQKENGCFHSSGTLLNNAMKGGVDNEVSLTAYITIALLEIPLPVTHSVVRNALFCLETAANAEENHVYTKALLAYTFALAGMEEKRKAMLGLLEKEAVKKDGSVHWQRPGKEMVADLPYYHYRAPSAEVEMTAYVLLAHLTTQPAPSQQELSFASLIAKWISGQQNPNGGFSSTQDTVVALQALSLYGAVTYAKSGTASQVTLRSGGDFQQDFQVDPSNRLLLQRVPLPQVPGEYSAEVSGEGCVYLQTSLRYNVQPTQEDAPFTLHVYTTPETCEDSQAHKVFNIGINVSYTGERNVSNMVIVDVKMLSGFIPVKSSVRKLSSIQPFQIQRTEVSSNHVLVYIAKLNSETLSFSFTVERDIPVQGLKPAQVKVYDYYETDEFATQEYRAPCTTEEVDQGNV
ncbi:alpha-2-macroglobulin isoform X2 [Anas platyrhynchos]|uniref:alpha-2-macroglobulin isoform X2 n=1 Tax=Anas platyrhynchos TaxID=8839 RepID=UPI000F7C8BC5|nr:alpha-2-macroglobulin isoform X1 [Anas platyrhynchos]|eukprot:XP_027305672.1 alpha-2-macroglobulin isoform X1 [Anas platyrhynchos]